MKRKWEKLPKSYLRNDIGTPKNTYELYQKPVGLDSKLIDFQKMTYNLQLGEKSLEYPTPVIPLWVEHVEPYQSIQNEFENVMEYLLDENISINFIKGIAIQNQSNTRFGSLDYEYLSLFSGGLDSITIPFLPKYSEKKGILHHTITHKIPQGRAITIFKKYFKSTKKQNLVTSINKNKVNDPAHLKTRGLIFLTNALCVASELDIPEVIIPENGPFMINIPVSSNVDPTRTTDPYMIENWTKIFNKITESKIIIRTPFKNMTKADVILSSGNRDLIQDTWSCSYFQGLHHMCGMCNSCLIRILSCYAIDEGEVIDASYEENPFTVVPSSLGESNQRNYAISKDNAFFCRAILNQEDLNDIEKTKFVNLTKLHPVLFNYALDLMLGFQNLSAAYESTQPLFTYFRSMLDYIDLNLLEKRKSQLVAKKYRTGWN